MDREEITRRFSLANSKEWKAIKELFLDKIIELSRGSQSPEKLQGMLQLLSFPDNWIDVFYAEKRKIEKEERK